jgi:DNA invertase Pin-like site-specific DNA recombinase
MIRERTLAGLERAKFQGKTLGWRKVTLDPGFRIHEGTGTYKDGEKVK